MEAILLKTAALITALTVIVGGVAALAKCIVRVYKMMAALEQHTLENYMCTLRLSVMSPYMPMEERLAAGEKYVKEGGNGAIKVKYEQLRKQYEKEAGT